MTSRLASCRDAARAGHSRYPVVREMVLDSDTAVTAFRKIHRGGFGFLLESLEGGERWARYTFMATEPAAVFRYRDGRVERADRSGSWTTADGPGSPLEHLSSMLRSTTAPAIEGLPRFTGGAVGFWGYEVIREIEELPGPPADDRDLPEAVTMLVDTLLVVDHLFHRAIVVANAAIDSAMSDREMAAALDEAGSRAEEWIERLRRDAGLAPLDRMAAQVPIDATSPYPAERFVADVARCQEYIAAGDAFQIVLSRRLDIGDPPDPFTTYRWLRALNPAPYCYYLELGDLTLAGASPEVLVRVEDERVTVRPIAGTRRRGRTGEEDAALEADLLADPKERAEHLMLVDLGRNDVGRVSVYGSVKVVAEMVVERYSQVMHLVSEVQGRLRPELDALDALRATFPAGTVSGAPKVRAMEIIDSMEPTRRGPYAGAVGYIGYGARNLDTAIAIRTVVFSGRHAWVQAGAGIVADSIPEAELQETLAKARAVLVALQCAKGGTGPGDRPSAVSSAGSGS